jgi:hypothetical protein
MQPEYCPGTTTYISKTNPHIKTSRRPDLCNDKEIQILAITTPSIETLYLFNIYNEKLRYDQTLPYTLDRTHKYIHIPARSILVRDFNAHHLWWNSSTKRPIHHKTLLQITEEGNLSS